MRQATEEKYRQICRLREQGMRIKEIAAEMECSASVVDRAVKVFREGELRRACFADHKDEIVGMYKDGATLKEIAEAAGLSITTINRHMLDMGIHRGKGWKPERAHRRLREPMCHREQGEQEGEIPAPRQYAVHVRRVRKIRVKVNYKWKTMQDVSDWWL